MNNKVSKHRLNVNGIVILTIKLKQKYTNTRIMPINDVSGYTI